MPLPLRSPPALRLILFIVTIAAFTYRLVEVPFIRMGTNIATGKPAFAQATSIIRRQHISGRFDHGASGAGVDPLPGNALI